MVSGIEHVGELTLGSRRIAFPLVEGGEHWRDLFFPNAIARRQLRHKDTPVGHPQADVLRAQAVGSGDVDDRGHDLGVGRRTRLADDVHVELKVLPEPPPLLALVPEQLGDGEPPDRLFQGLCPRPNHSRERGRHFRSQGDAPVTLVREFVELADDFLSALRRVQLQRLERRSIVLLEAIATRDLAPGREDVVAEGEFFGVKVAKSR